MRLLILIVYLGFSFQAFAENKSGLFTAFTKKELCEEQLQLQYFLAFKPDGAKVSGPSDDFKRNFKTQLSTFQKDCKGTDSEKEALALGDKFGELCDRACEASYSGSNVSWCKKDCFQWMLVKKEKISGYAIGLNDGASICAPVTVEDSKRKLMEKAISGK